MRWCRQGQAPRPRPNGFGRDCCTRSTSSGTPRPAPRSTSCLTATSRRRRRADHAHSVRGHHPDIPASSPRPAAAQQARPRPARPILRSAASLPRAMQRSRQARQAPDATRARVRRPVRRRAVPAPVCVVRAPDPLGAERRPVRSRPLALDRPQPARGQLPTSPTGEQPLAAIGARGLPPARGSLRHGSLKRVASAVGEGSICIRLVHEYLALTP